MHPDESEHSSFTARFQDCRETMERSSSRGSSMYTNLKVLHASGRPVNVDITISEFRFGDRRIMQCIFSDVSDRNLADQSLRRTNQALQALSSCNEALMHARDEVSLLEDICRIIVCIAGYRFAHISRLAGEGDGDLDMVASFGYAEPLASESLQQCSGLDDPRWPGSAALRTASVSVINDIENDVSASAWKHQVLELGCRSVHVRRIDDLFCRYRRFR